MASPPLYWDVRAESTSGETRVHFTGDDVELDDGCTDRLRHELDRLVDDAGHIRTLLDFANVSYLTSSTLGVLVQLHRRLHASGGRLTVVNARPHIYEVFA